MAGRKEGTKIYNGITISEAMAAFILAPPSRDDMAAMRHTAEVVFPAARAASSAVGICSGDGSLDGLRAVAAEMVKEKNGATDGGTTDGGTTDGGTAPAKSGAGQGKGQAGPKGSTAK